MQRPTPRVQILFNGSQCRPISAACGCSEFQSRPLGPSRTWPGPQYKWGLNEYRMHCRDRYDAGAHGRSWNLGWPIPAKPPIPSSEAAPLHRGPPRAIARNCARKASRGARLHRARSRRRPGRGGFLLLRLPPSALQRAPPLPSTQSTHPCRCDGQNHGLPCHVTPLHAPGPTGMSLNCLLHCTSFLRYRVQPRRC